MWVLIVLAVSVPPVATDPPTQLGAVQATIVGRFDSGRACDAARQARETKLAGEIIAGCWRLLTP